MDRGIYVIFASLCLAMLSISSLNVQGHGPDRLSYINNVCQNTDILLLQEHWLLDDQLKNNFFETNIQNVCCHGTSGIKDNVLLNGRPYGGCAIMWRKDLVACIKPLHTQSERLCAIECKINNVSVIIFNVYMPVDTNYDMANLSLFESILEEIFRICEESDTQNCIVGGDMNTDFSRRHSLHTQSLERVIQTEYLSNTTYMPNAEVDYTYESKSNGRRSILDHILVTNNLISHVTTCRSIHDGDNLSDHELLNVTLNVQNLSYAEDTVPIHRVTPKWHVASEKQLDDYTRVLDQFLGDIKVPWGAIHCDDYFCHQHCICLQEYHDAIIQCCLTASKSTIPHSGDFNAKVVPGWGDVVEHHRKCAMFWHSLWKDNGSPRHGTLADIRRNTRAKYHYAIRKCQNNKDLFSANKMAEAILENKDRDFWSEVNKIKQKVNSSANNIDGHIGEEAIGNRFASKYEELYNCKCSFDQGDMYNFIKCCDNDIKKQCCENKCYSSHCITAQDVHEAIGRLKCGKHDGVDGHYSDHLKNGTSRLETHLSLLFTSMLKHSFAPSGFRVSTIIPIPKNKRNSLNESDNYRAIALSSILGKVLDNVILEKHEHVLSTSDLQFGFKKKHSTSQCTFMAKEIIQYYANNQTSVFTVLLDASKAFDHVKYIKLFELLKRKGVCGVFARFLAVMYSDQTACVQWGAHTSPLFSVTNGVKQGGVLSPILFGVYIDELLLRLKTNGAGCHVGQLFVGAFAYADDLILLAPTRHGILSMLSIAQEYSAEYGIAFNPNKSRLIVFNENNHVDMNLIFDGSVIPNVGKEKHLGNFIGPDVGDDGIKISIGDFYRRVNVTFAQFSKVEPDVKYKLFKSLCMSLYGCQLWDYSSSHVQLFYTAWRKCIRRMWSLPYRTHCSLLHLICQDTTIEVQLHKRFLNFFKSIIESSNTCMQIMGQVTLRGSCSATSNSLTYICQQYGLSKYTDIKTKFINKICNVTDNGNSDAVVAGTIRDFCNMRYRHTYHAPCQDTVLELTDIIAFLCTG